jgi:nucleoside 2-deoxyribosyltransferase
MQKSNRIRVYVAGAYSADNVMGVLGNIGRGRLLAYKAFKAGFAPFVPWHDADFAMLGAMFNDTLTVKDFYEFCMEWLRASEAVLVEPIGAQESKGTQAELAEARRLGIPVFWSLEELTEWRASRG